MRICRAIRVRGESGGLLLTAGLSVAVLVLASDAIDVAMVEVLALVIDVSDPKVI